jgi:signal transduction histidine kinase
MTHPPRTAARLEHLLARGVLAVRRRSLDWIRRHPVLTDAALAAVVLAVSVLAAGHAGERDKSLSVVLPVALVCPLAWRRRAPFAVFLVMTGVAVAQLYTTQEVNNDFVLLVAFYTLAAYQPPRRVLAAAAILVAGAALVTATARYTLGMWALLSGLVAVTGLLGYAARTRRGYLAALTDRAERMERERDQQAQLAATSERTRIAREMHDIVAHNIAVMIALADGAAYTAAASPEQAASLMGEVSATGRSALTEMRRLLGVLREPAPHGHAPQPTLDRVTGLLASVRAAGLPTRLTVTGQPFPLPDSAQLTVYRVIQEALTNTLKHAPGATAQVRLAYLTGEVELEVTDDGGHPPGVPAAGAPGAGQAAGWPAGGHGIAGMRERAAVFGGQVTAGSCPDGGWRVHTVLQVRPEPADSEAVTAAADAQSPAAAELQ